MLSWLHHRRGDAVPVGTGGGGHESHQGRPAGGRHRQGGPQRGDRRRQRSHRVRRDRCASGGRGNHRPQPVLGDPRADRSPHAHDVLLGPHARYAAAGPAAAAGGRDGRARRRQRPPDPRDRRHDRARPRRVERDRLRDARSDQHGQDGRAADVRRRPGPVGAARRRTEAGLPAAGGGARDRRIGLGQGLRLARQLSERGHDADAHIRRDEGGRRRRAREEAGRSRSIRMGPPASKMPCAPAPIRSSTASIWTTRRSRRWSRRGTVWVPTIDHNRYYVDAKDEFGFAPDTIPAAARPTSRRTSSPRAARSRRASKSGWDRTPSTRCSARTRASWNGSSRPA